MKKSTSSKLTIPNDLSYGPIVGSYVKAVAQKVGFNEEDQMMIELGVDEAFTNVVEHAFEPDEEATFDIICERIPLGLQIAIREKGMPFDPSQIPVYDPGAKLEERSTTGLGFFLMKRSMDEVFFNNLGKDGKETQLIKYLEQKSIEDYFEESELGSFEEQPKKKKKKKIELDVRMMEAPEAIEVSKCIYKTYGYSYDKEHAYYPERIVELNESGLLESALAVTKENEMAGHCALMKDHAEDKIAEIGMAVVKPTFRGQGCLKHLSAYLMDRARTEGLTGIYAQAVSNHPYSQRAMHKFGFHDCGMLLANVPTTRSFKGLTEKLEQRESYVISFQYLNKPEDLVVYPPDHHKDMIEKIYHNIGLSPACRAPGGADASCEERPDGISGESIQKTKVLTGKGIAYIQLSYCGLDALKEVRVRLKDLCLKRLDVIYLYLGLQNPSSHSLVSEFEKMGFFFGGVFPGTQYGDALILQYLNNVSIDYSKIALDSEMGKELAAYIEQHDRNKAE